MMKHIESSKQRIKNRDFRLTKTRQAMIDIFFDTHKPFTTHEINQLLVNKKISCHKTTIYRELEFLRNQKLVYEVDFGDGLKRFESSLSGHHHHLVCTNCQTIDDIALENDMQSFERIIRQHTDFQVANHSFEFYGLCIQCQTIKR